MPSRADGDVARQPSSPGDLFSREGARRRWEGRADRTQIALHASRRALRNASGALLLLASACAGRIAPETAGAPPLLAPWEIPPVALLTQRLYRVGYSGPEGEGALRVTLRFSRPERYQLQAVDPLGRSLFTLDAADGSGLLLNHRSRRYCRFRGVFETADLPLGPFPLVALPTLLLDRIPVTPPDPPSLSAEMDFVDAAGRRWSVSVDAKGAPTSWTLREGGEPVIWWSRRDGWSVLSDRKRGVQVRWRLVVEEALGREIPTPALPADYREGNCNSPDLPDPEVSADGPGA